MSSNRMPVVRWRDVGRVLLGALLIWASVSKLANPTDFLGNILAYELPLSRVAAQLIAVVLPWLELLCGLALIANFWTTAALATTTVLLAVFIVATGQAWARGLDISCGCFDPKAFGLNKSHPGLVHFIESVAFAFFRNLVLGAVAVLLLRHSLRTPAQPVAGRVVVKEGRRPKHSRR